MDMTHEMNEPTPVEPNVFTFIDYRAYLSAYLDYKKAVVPHFSIRSFALKCGIKSQIQISMVLDRKRNSGPKLIEKFCKGIRFSKKQSRYFRHLVQFNQAKSLDAKQEHYAVLRTLRNSVHEKVLGSDFYDYYEHWYTAVVRELVCLYDFGDDWLALSKAVFPAITPKEARAAVELLLRLCMIKKNDSGKYVQQDPAITSGDDITSLALRQFNKKMVELAAGSIERIPPERRHVSGITMGITREQYRVLETEIEAFKERVVNFVRESDDGDEVYQMNVSFFPTSRVQPEGNDA